MTEFVRGVIDEQWELMLPDFRKRFYEERPNWERGRLEHCARTFKPGMTVYDVGAEHGCMTALYRSWVGGNVVPIEPSQPYWPCIRGTYEANGYGPPPAWFVGFASDTTNLRPYRAAFGRGSWPQIEGEIIPDFGFRHLAQQAMDTAQVTLDRFARWAALPPDAVVIDVEGAEGRVLAGLVNTLMERDVLVYVSVHEPTMLAWYGQTLADLHALMGSAGYSGTELPHHGEGETFWLWERR